MSSAHETLVILDFGSQYTKFFARRAREIGVYSIILPFSASLKEIKEHNPKGIVLSGGPSSLYEADSPKMKADIWGLGLPVLGICYGMYVVADHFGGKIESSKIREYGHAIIELSGKSRILEPEFDNSTVWMSHGDHVLTPPKDFIISAKSGGLIAGIEHKTKPIFGLQFHLEVSQSHYGEEMLRNFVSLCDFSGVWEPGSEIENYVKEIKEQAGSANVICALSGGVDSSVAAVLVDRAIGKQQTCIFVDNGLLRKDEFEQVLQMYKDLGLNIKPIRAAEQFYKKLAGVTDPEIKRKAIGTEFIKIFEREAKKLDNVKFLVQGTLYPDVIESVTVKGPSATIKSHHNVGGLPEKMHLKLIEPLRELFKDEVRKLGAELGLSEEIVQRQAFPGPGLAVRIVGEITEERVHLLQEADAIVREEIEKVPEVRNTLYQYFAVLLPVKSVGVMGDARSYEHAAVVKAFTSRDVMTTDWARLPYDLLAKISSRIVSEVRGINRVVYEITTKPPSTVEWE